MRWFLYSICVLFSMSLITCSKDKYSQYRGDATLSGYLYLADNIRSSPVTPVAGERVFLTLGNDTSHYETLVNADSAGMFSFYNIAPYNDFTLFARFLKNGITYNGSTHVEKSNNNNVVTTLSVYPNYVNGMSILFNDAMGGAIANLPFRLYTTRVIALVDSARYAFADVKSDSYGLYNRYNINPGNYYIVSRDTIGTQVLRIFDSITVDVKDVKKGTVVLK